MPDSSSAVADFGSASTRSFSARIPWLGLDREGTIQHVSRAGRYVLEYSSDTSLDRSFFSYVHERNVDRVMRDLAQMVHHQKQTARWLLRLWTGAERWRWYRASVRNRLHRPDGLVHVQVDTL